MSYYIYQTDASSKAEAEKQALEYLNLKKGDLEFEDVGEKKGVMGFFKGGASVLLAFPAHENIPIEAHAKGVITLLVKKMNVEASIKEVSDKDGNVYIELTSEDTGFLIGKYGRMLDSLQFLVNLIVHTNCKDKKRIMLDVDGYRDRREKSLIELADKTAERVSKTGNSALLNYMNPYERRIVHMHLEEDDRVKTQSDGNGVYKRLRVISLVKKAKKKKDNSSRGNQENETQSFDNKQPVSTDSQELYDELAQEQESFAQQKLYEEEEVVENVVEGGG